jgi:hypothetical protein
VMRCKESHPSGWDRCLLCILHDDVHICICSGAFLAERTGGLSGSWTVGLTRDVGSICTSYTIENPPPHVTLLGCVAVSISAEPLSPR